jgi:hypothetical protein
VAPRPPRPDRPSGRAVGVSAAGPGGVPIERSGALRDGAVIVRLTATDRGWVAALPPVPDGRQLTVSVGHPSLLPVPVDELIARGYRIVGVAAEHRPIGLNVDVLVPRELRAAHPDWWVQLLGQAERVFDLRLGPVRHVLAAELALHLRAFPA